MSSIDMILKAAAPKAVPPDPEVVEADLARGRAALATAHRRRTYRRATWSGVSLAVAGGIAAAISTPGSTHGASSAPVHREGAKVKITSPTASRKGGAASGQPQIELVAYRGSQLPGFTVSQVPQGWHLSTSTSTALLITPDDSTNNDPDDFLGKLAVLTSSVDQQDLGSGDPVTVDGQPGRVSREAGTLMLAYDSPNGFGVNVQAPASLGWSDAQLVEFAEGVQVTSNAVHSHG